MLLPRGTIQSSRVFRNIFFLNITKERKWICRSIEYRRLANAVRSGLNVENLLLKIDVFLTVSRY